MKLPAAALALIIFAVFTTPGLAVTYKSTDGAVNLDASRIEILSDKLVATGKVHLHWVDSIKKITVNADAQKMVVKTMPEQGAKTSKPRTTVESATLSGPTRIVYVTTDAAGKSTITANADNADFDGKANLVHLTGSVKIINDNPAMFSAPATMTGDKATLNLKPQGPDDFRFRVETAEPGTSSVTATPKAQKAE